jgi:hypothetical protein
MELYGQKELAAPTTDRLTTHQVGSDELHLTRNPRWCWFRYG